MKLWTPYERNLMKLGKPNEIASKKPTEIREPNEMFFRKPCN